MIRLTPAIDLQYTCPSCKNIFEPGDWHITGMHSMCSGTCQSCGKEFFMEMPVNAGLFYPGMLDAATGERCDELPFDNWYLSGLVEAYKKRKDYAVDFKVEKNRELTRPGILILNTIDGTYGHALFELLNASYYLKNPDTDLIILVQKNMRWLVPAGAAQVWTADISFSKAGDWNNWLANRIKKELPEHKNIFICRSFVQADSSDYEIQDYTGVQPFPLEEWDERLEKPTVTFVWRTDRFWKPVLPKAINNRITRKIAPRTITKLKNNLEFKWILRFSEELRKVVPNLDFAIAGMDDRKYELPSWIKDFRYPSHEDDTAKLQCERYAQSHVVIGCNGSSLVLPGCHSGAMINIIPGEQWAVSAGTFPFRITSIGDTHFRYVMVPGQASLKNIISILVSILRDRSLILLHTSKPWRDHEARLDHFAWSRFREQSYHVATNFNSSEGLITMGRKKPAQK
ncbi:MAG TPA: hypothetical protein VKT28_06360 [Puia sp.]|nr:hypothetical protein [Puia sp.]